MKVVRTVDTDSKLYISSGFYTGHSFNVILGIGIVGLIMYILSIFKPVHAPKKANTK